MNRQYPFHHDLVASLSLHSDFRKIEMEKNIMHLEQLHYLMESSQGSPRLGSPTSLASALATACLVLNALLICQIVWNFSSHMMPFCARVLSCCFFCLSAVLLFVSHPEKMTDTGSSFEVIVTLHFLPKASLTISSPLLCLTPLLQAPITLSITLSWHLINCEFIVNSFVYLPSLFFISSIASI